MGLYIRRFIFLRISFWNKNPFSSLLFQKLVFFWNKAIFFFFSFNLSCGRKFRPQVLSLLSNWSWGANFSPQVLSFFQVSYGHKMWPQVYRRKDITITIAITTTITITIIIISRQKKGLGTLGTQSPNFSS